MILLVVGLVAVLVVVFIAVILSIRLGHGDEHDEPDLPPRGRGRLRDDEDEDWPERDDRRVPAAAARGMDSHGRRGENPGYADRGAVGDRAARGRDYGGPPRRPARADATGYREPVGARSPVPVSAQAGGRYDTGPQRRPTDGDFAAADYSSMDHPEDRPEPRRKGASANGKSRSRQRGKRNNNDDDWPSTEWDKLSDEQYWAELSADKPLAAMAKPSRPASKSGAHAPVNGSAKRAAEPPAAREPRRARTPAPTPPARDMPSRNERTEPREPVTERLPVRTRQQPPAPGARRDAGAPLAGSRAPGPRSARDTGQQARPDPLRDSGQWARSDTGPQARRDPLRDSGQWARGDTGPQARPDPLRDSGQWARSDTSPHPMRDTGPHASRDRRPRPDQPRRSTAPDPARDRDMAMLAGLASTPPPVPGALDDDPLTSPSFSLKADTAADSRSYGGSRKHAKPTGAGHAYQAAPPAAPVEQWHSAPPAPAKGRHTTAYGDPYQHAGHSAGHGGYGADPLNGYSPSAYEAPRYPDPGMAGPPLPAAGQVPYANGHAQPAYPGQSAYPDGHSAGGYGNGYDAGYGGDPYAGGGYGPYPPRG